MSTIDYYEKNASAFIDQTQAADMAQHYERFLHRIPDAGSILDAGSGSGRDAAWFKARGYHVEAFDASPAMVNATQQLAQVPTRLMTFEDFEWGHQFDGIWACASLLHVQRNRLTHVFDRLLAALQPGGCIYCSFKLGTEEREVNGRYFNDLDSSLLETLLSGAGGRVEDTWITGDVRPGRHGESWLNALLAKQVRCQGLA